MKKTKILCTIGPASASIPVLNRMYKAGMNGVRLNTAFWKTENSGEIIKNIREVGDIPILLDLKGPEIRIKVNQTVTLKKGDEIQIGNEKNLEFSYSIYNQLIGNDRVLIDDGKISMNVTSGDKNHVNLTVDKGGIVENGKGVNIPGKRLIVPTLSDRDLEALLIAKKYNVEFIALSFVRGKEDLTNLKGFAYDLQAQIIAKIENPQGVKNFESILREADGIMIARGDLGIEMELEQIPLIQKRMIQRCNQEGKLAIIATEMLESMMNNPIPTRAEVSDVANAILDGADTLMLSGETAIGHYPVDVIYMMNKIAGEVERSTRTTVKEEEFRTISNTISRSIWQIANTMPLDKVVTMTRTGYTAKMISRFKLAQPIIVLTPDKVVRNQLELFYGTQSFYFDYESEEDRVLAVAHFLYSKEILNKDDMVLFTAGLRTSRPHSSNLIEIHTIKELLEFDQSKK